MAIQHEQLEVAIVGGGIVGVMLAVGLCNQGAKVKVYEQSRGFREIGAGVAFTAAAQRCMGMIDPAVHAAFKACGAMPLKSADASDPNDYLSWVDGYNQRRPDDPDYETPLFKLDAGYKGFAGTRRDMLLEALDKAIPDGVIEFRKRLEDFYESGPDDKIQLKFVDGSTAKADVVFGCDGLKSRVREYLFGVGNPISYPHYSKKFAYRGLVTMENAIKALGKEKAQYFNMHVGPGANVLTYPVANGAMINAVAFISDAEDWTDQKNMVKPAVRADMERVFEKWNPSLRRLASFFPENIDKWGLFDHWDYPAPFYTRGRICLVGDAAHASSPHHGAGVAMGIEDALCITSLWGEITASLKKDGATPMQAIHAAFQSYDSVRRARSQWFVNSSRRVCDIFQQDEWADPAKWVKAETGWEEVRDRSFKIWHFNPGQMVEDVVKSYVKQLSLITTKAGIIATKGIAGANGPAETNDTNKMNGTAGLKGPETANGIAEPFGINGTSPAATQSHTNSTDAKPAAKAPVKTYDNTEPNGIKQSNGIMKPSGKVVANEITSLAETEKTNGATEIHAAEEDQTLRTSGSDNLGHLPKGNDVHKASQVSETNGTTKVDHTNLLSNTGSINGVAETNGAGTTQHVPDAVQTNGHGKPTEAAIPTIDITPWRTPGASQEEKDAVVKQVHDACSTYGFFNLIGHGVPAEAQKAAWAASKRFFDLPLEEKMKVSVDKSLGKSFRGYEPSLIQTHREGLLPDTKECFITGRETPADHPDAGTFSTGPNLWPDGLPKESFHDPVMEYRNIMLDLVKRLAQILGQGLPKEWGCPPHVFDELVVEPSIPMRLLHYAPQTDIDPRQFGVGDHSDFGCISILLQEKDTRGLEVFYPPTRTWIPVPVIENAYVINIGDTMDKWTNSHYRSARHRVVNYPGQARNSIAFFLNGNLKLNIKPLDGSAREEMSISEHIRGLLAHTMGKNGKFLR